MRFQAVAGFLALALAVTAMPADRDPSKSEQHHDRPPKGEDVDIKQQQANVCGGQILSCCNQYNIYYGDVEKRSSQKQIGFLPLAGIVELVGGILGAEDGSADDNYACYEDYPTTHCQGVQACCPGGGNECKANGKAHSEYE